jgi:hypothetical protein
MNINRWSGKRGNPQTAINERIERDYSELRRGAEYAAFIAGTDVDIRDIRAEMSQRRYEAWSFIFFVDEVEANAADHADILDTQRSAIGC